MEQDHPDTSETNETNETGYGSEVGSTDFITKKLRNVGPRKLTKKEALLCDAIAKHIGENDQVTKEIPYTDLDKSIRMALSPAVKGNLIQRGIFDAIWDDEHRLAGIKFTDAGFQLYITKIARVQSGDDVDDEPASRKPRKNGESVTRRSKFDVPGVKVKVMTSSNPRREGTHGFYSFKLYRDGMSFRDYMTADWKALGDVKLRSTLKNWDGPRLDHFNWDLKEGNIALYDENQPATLENGQPNPDYWVVNNAGGLRRLRALANGGGSNGSNGSDH
ncbi:MAG: hypothetical protein ACJ8LM_16580 [Candidatus Udaeobacter sp.]